MPTWLKIALAGLIVVILLIAFTGFMLVDVFKREAAASKRAGAEGKGFGFNNSLDACVEAGVQRAGSCEKAQFGCVLRADAFLWGCVDAANYDEGFCAKVPLSGHDAATLRWSRSACSAYGHPDNETCFFALQVVPSFCTYRKQNG